MADIKLVRLFYLGGIKTQSKRAATVSSGREIITLPPVGEYLELKEHVAVDLERKHKYILPNGDTLDVFTRDARVAKRVRDGMTPQQAYAPQITTSDFSDEALLKELKKRGIAVESEEAEEPTESSVEEVVVEDPAPVVNKGGRKKKVQPEIEDPLP